MLMQILFVNSLCNDVNMIMTFEQLIYAYDISVILNAVDKYIRWC